MAACDVLYYAPVQAGRGPEDGWGPCPARGNVWTDDAERCRQAGIPTDRPFATKPQMAQQMLARAFAAGVPATWVTGDSVYGDNRPLRQWLEAQPQAYVLAVSGKEYVWLGAQQRRVNTFLASLPVEGGDPAQCGRRGDRAALV